MPEFDTDTIFKTVFLPVTSVEADGKVPGVLSNLLLLNYKKTIIFSALFLNNYFVLHDI